MREAWRKAQTRIAENDPSFDENEYVCCGDFYFLSLSPSLLLPLARHSLSFLSLNLILSQVKLGKVGSVALAEALETNTHLKTLV
jgi:hypothetical protein